MKKVRRKKTGRPKLVEGDDIIRVGFSVPEQFWARIVALSKKEETSYSVIVRRALVAYLKQIGEEKKNHEKNI